jgi:hypothetical protein
VVEINMKQQSFLEILKKAYEKGLTENQITVEKMIAELEEDLKKVLTR